MTNTIADRIRERLAATRQTPNGASQRAGSPSLIPNILNGRSKNPRIDTLAKIAPVLETTANWLLTGQDEPAPASAPAEPAGPDEIVVADFHIPVTGNQPQDIPLIWTAAGSIIGDDIEGFQFQGEVIGHLRRPPSLANIREAYGILVTGDSMDPIHPPGEPRIVNPLRPTAPGDTVIVVTQRWADDPGQAYIKILLRRTQRAIFLKQLNPEAVLEIPTQYVKSVHYVLTYRDLLGW